MKILEAISSIKDDLEDNPLIPGCRLEKAKKLGIEALKWRLTLEQDYGSWCDPPLPGETKD